MALEIKTMLESILGIRADWKEDWKEDAAADWRFDWDDVPGDAAPASPSNVAPPVISGVPQVGETLSVTTGTWAGNPTPTFTFQWYSDNTVMTGEITSTLTLQASDVGALIKCRVTATNVVGSAFADSAEVGPVMD